LKKIKKSQKIKLLYGSLQKASILMLKILINIEFESKKIILIIWGDSVNKLKEKSGKTLKKRIICMKALRNHQFRATKFIEYLYFNQTR
jgi:hypothetical protein